jgi:beta-lactamase regulating signal transducer with metallopeptidase domain
MMSFDFQSVAEVVAGRGLNTVIEGVALAGLSWAALRCFGARSSMTRFAVWFSTLLVIAGLPLLSRTTSPQVVSGSHVPELTLTTGWAAGLFAVWALIASVLLGRLAFSLRHLHVLRQQCREIDASSYPALVEVGQEFARARRVQLLSSSQVRVPTALGFFHPAVVLPEWTLRDLSPDELKVIVLHELAHLHRWDDWTNLAQKIVKALFFFHPAVWWIDSRLALEREIACDDMVLEQTANARTYAASLVSVAEKVVAEKMRMGRALALAQSALGRAREVSLRVAQILDTRRARTSRGWRPAMAIIGTLAVITAGAMPYAPELISFQSKSGPAFSAAEDTPAFGARAVPASWTISPAVASRQKLVGETNLRADGSTRRNVINKVRAVSGQTLIPAKARRPAINRAPKVVAAKAAARTHLAETLLVMRSTQLDENGMPLWTLSVWRVKTAHGYQQMVQETIAMSAL